MKILPILVVLAAGLVVGLVVTGFTSFTDQRGLISGLGSIDRNYLMGLAWASFILVGLGIVPLKAGIRKHLLVLWLLRSFVTLGFMLVYEYHYVKLDAFFFFQYGRAGEYEWNFMNGSNTLMMIIQFLTHYVPFADSYHAIKVIWSFLGFLGGYFFYLSYERITQKPSMQMLWMLCAFPSILFWSSILGKDPLVFFGLGLACYGAVRTIRDVDRVGVLTFIFGLIAVGSIRLWTACAVLFAVALCFLSLNVRRTQAMMILKFAVWCGLFFFTGKLVENFQVATQADLMEKVNVISRGWSQGGSQQEVPELKSFGQMVRFLPRGMFTALFRPLPGEVNNLFGAIAGVENMILLIFAISALSWMRSEFVQDKAVQFLLLTILIWTLIYAFISYQNLGSAVRFKIQVLPFVLLAAWVLKEKHREWQLRS